jgi:hypothetical protein
MRKVILLLLSLSAGALSAIPSLTLPNEDINGVDTPQVVWVDQNFDSVKVRVNHLVDTTNIYLPGSGVFLGTFYKSLTNARVGIDFDANATGNYFWLSHNTADTLFRVRDDSSVYIPKLTASLPVFTNGNKELASNAMTGTGSVVMSASPTLTGTLTAAAGSFSSTLGLLGPLTIGQDGVSNAVTNTAISHYYNIDSDNNGTTEIYAWGHDAAITGHTRLMTLWESGNLRIGSTNTDPAVRLRVDGAAAVTGVTTFTAAPVFSSVTASEFLLVDGSKALTSVAGTGSGSVVRATSPTLTTPAIGAATGASLNLTGNLTADSLISSKFYEEGNFTITLTGIAEAGTSTAYYTRVGKSVTLRVASTGTSNATTKSLTGIPAAIRPASIQAFPFACTDNGAASATMCFAVINTDGTANLYKDATLGSWTASGASGFTYATTFHYLIKL